MDCLIALGSVVVRKVCQTIDCTVERVFLTRWFNSSISILDRTSSSLCLVRSANEAKYWIISPPASRTGLMKTADQNSLPSLRRQRTSVPLLDEPSNSALIRVSASASAPCAIRKLKLLPSTSSRRYPVRERKLSLAKMIGLSGSVASVNTIAIRVVSAATTNGPRSFRKLSTSASAPFCSIDFLVISDMPRVNQSALRVCVVQRAWRGLLLESRS